MNKIFLGGFAILAGILAIVAFTTINKIPTYEEAVNAAWSQVLNAYQRRTDLIPNLVETVKGAASHEQETFTAVIEMRSRVGQIKISADVLADPKALQLFQSMQDQLSSALSRLMAVAESYPELKANQNFRDLQAQLEGTENRIAVARRDYIQAVQIYNTELRTIPGRWWKDLLYPDALPKANFSIPEANMANPAVNFGTP